MDLKLALCIVNPDDKLYLQRYGSGVSENCVTPSEIEELKEKGVKFPDNGIRENTILVKLPHKNEYIYREPKDDEKIIQENTNTLSTILSYLGAKHAVCYVSIDEKTNSTTKVDQKTHINMGNGVNVQEPESHKDVGAEGKINVGVEVRTGKSLVLNKTQTIFDENNWIGTYTEDGYKEACKIARTSGLYEQSDVKALLEQRKPDHPNQNLCKRYKVDLFSEFQNTLDFAVNLKSDISKTLNLDKLAKANSYINASIDLNVEKSEYAKLHQIIEFEVEFCPFDNETTDSDLTEPSEIETTEPTGKPEDLNSLSLGKLIALVAGAFVVGAGIAIAIMKLL